MNDDNPFANMTNGDDEKEGFLPRSRQRRQRSSSRLWLVTVLTGSMVVACIGYVAFRLNTPAHSTADRETQKGQEALSKGDYDLAISCFNETLRRGPGSSRVYLLRAEAHLGKHQHQNAVADSTEAIRLNEKDGRNYLVRAIAYKGIKNNPHAIADCNSAIMLGLEKDDAAKAYQLRASAHLAIGLTDTAVDDCNTSISLNPSFGAAWATRAHARVEQRQFKKALEDIREAKRLSSLLSVELREVESLIEQYLFTNP